MQNAKVPSTPEMQMVDMSSAIDLTAHTWTIIYVSLCKVSVGLGLPTMNFLWKSERSMSLMNSFFLFLSSVPRAWFLKTTSSSHRRFMVKSLALSSGLPRAMSISRCSSSSAARSASCMVVSLDLQVLDMQSYLFRFGFCALLFDLLQFAHQCGSLVLLIVPK
jgi:hypothetical protein